MAFHSEQVELIAKLMVSFSQLKSIIGLMAAPIAIKGMLIEGITRLDRAATTQQNCLVEFISISPLTNH